MKNNYPLEQTSRVRILPNNTLAIDRAQADDSGNYLCRASNGYKEAEDSVNLTVEDLQVIILITPECFDYDFSCCRSRRIVWITLILPTVS